MARPSTLDTKKMQIRRIRRNLEERRVRTPRGQRLREKDKMVSAMGGYLTGGQAKIAAKAEPRNKIDAKDFAVLRAEKAKGRGQGLQDEKMKPGKVMKADKGKMIKQDPTKAVNPFAKRAAEAAKATKIGKIAAGVAAVGLATKAGLEKLYEKRTGKRAPTKRPKKKMGGGMMMRPRPMGYDKGDLVKPKQKKRKKDPRSIKGPGPIGSMGTRPRPGGGPRPKAGIPNVPERIGRPPVMPTPKLAVPSPYSLKVPQMSTGSSVTVKVKLGKNKPTKLF